MGARPPIATQDLIRFLDAQAKDASPGTTLRKRQHLKPHLSDLQQLITAVNYSTGTDADNAVQACSNATRTMKRRFSSLPKTRHAWNCQDNGLAHCTIHANAINVNEEE